MAAAVAVCFRHGRLWRSVRLCLYGPANVQFCRRCLRETLLMYGRQLLERRFPLLVLLCLLAGGVTEPLTSSR